MKYKQKLHLVQILYLHRKTIWSISNGFCNNKKKLKTQATRVHYIKTMSDKNKNKTKILKKSHTMSDKWSQRKKSIISLQNTARTLLRHRGILYVIPQKNSRLWLNLRICNGETSFVSEQAWLSGFSLNENGLYVS